MNGTEKQYVSYLVLRYLHVLGAIIILGTGIGIAFFMVMAHRSGDAVHIARTASVIVLADAVFTGTAVILQPVTGVLLLNETGRSITEGWVLLSLALYAVAGLFWLPVVWMQMRMRDLARAAARSQHALPARYHRLYHLWFWCGLPGFASVLAILWLMIARPSL
jgi:uncharacterized membrane protein